MFASERERESKRLATSKIKILLYRWTLRASENWNKEEEEEDRQAGRQKGEEELRITQQKIYSLLSSNEELHCLIH
jgi:hypothetical protein